MLLVLTDKNDVHADYVIEKLLSESISLYRFNLDVSSLRNTTLTYQNFQWAINQEHGALDLDAISCVWNRRTFVELLLEEENDQTPDFKIWKNEWNKTLLGIYTKLRDYPWLNPWRNSYAAENKYWQMELARKHNIEVPLTLVSNSRQHILAFSENHGPVALKLMHQDFYKTDTGFKGLYVNRLFSSDFEKFGADNENPIVLQKYIDKEFEVRYTVVGKNHYVCKIESQKSKQANIDWRRYDIPNTPHSIIEPPKEIKAGVEGIMKDLCIEYGAFDFIVDKEKKWIFLEVNSMGQFLWIEDLAGLPISKGIVDWVKNKINNP